jgi:hypothetical protein
MIFVGVDLGKDGGVVSVDPGGAVLDKTKVPLITSAKAKSEYDIPGIVNLVKSLLPAVFIIEKAQPMPMVMGGTQANFQRGLSFGLWQGILTALGVSYEAVAPQRWQKVMLAGINAADTKQAALIAAQRIWPKEDWRKSERAKKADEGLVDAALIGEWGRRSRKA